MYGVTPQNRETLIAHLREHFVDSPWGTAGVLSHGQYDVSGNMTTPPDPSQFDGWLRLWPGARQYCVFVAVSDRLQTWPMGAPEFEKAVQVWIRFWAAHAREKGLRPEQLNILLVDEPQAPEQDGIILAWAKVIRAANTGIRIWEDTVHRDMSKANPDMIASCHVLCPNRQIFLHENDAYRDYYVQQRTRGIELQFYSCNGPARLLDPYAYHRLQAWTCWQYGATASYFWAFGDTGGASSWNEYAVKTNGYTPLFLDATSVTPGKHMEACRESIEDYEYLAMLQDAVNDATTKRVAGQAIERARAALAEWPDRVCSAGRTTRFTWQDARVDRSMADRARLEILEALLALRNAK
jgi:hypothetical protein